MKDQGEYTISVHDHIFFIVEPTLIRPNPNRIYRQHAPAHERISLCDIPSSSYDTKKHIKTQAQSGYISHTTNVSPMVDKHQPQKFKRKEI